MKLFAILITFSLLGFALSTIERELLPIEPRNPLSGKKWPKGSPWPLPYFHVTTDIRLTFNPSAFKFVVNVTGKCNPLDFIVAKYNNDFLFPTIEGVSAFPDPQFPIVSEVKVRVTGGANGNTECLNHPRLSDQPEIYEHYDINVEPFEPTLEIEAETVWGALRGIETFSQLIWSNENYDDGPLHFYINSTSIIDFPKYSHRGLMIDTARHYEPEEILYKIMDGMFYNKLNVFHWHIVDDQSFPYVSKKFPDLSAKGAYSKRHIYTPEAVQRIIEAGRLRGIRVILEFDTPGHVHGFGKAFPDLLTPCYGKPGVPGTPDFPNHAANENLDPTKELTYAFMREFFTELVQNVSRDQCVHLGMDEVYPNCWESSPEIAAFMIENNYTDIHQVQEHYIQRHVQMVQSLGAVPISWQDPLDFNVSMSKDVIIQVWKDWGLTWQEHLQAVLDKGYKVILSSPWYINYINYGESWRNYYEADPIMRLPNITIAQQGQILGGEACLWAEFVDKTNILPRLFPFVSAVAERLWSSGIPVDSNATEDARDRLDQQRCRLLQRGISAQPILCGTCGPWEV